RAAAGLETTGGEALHLEVEALPLAFLLADQVLRRHEVALEAERERVHAAVARRPVGLAVQHAAARLLHLELVAGEGILRHDEERESAGALLHVGVGAREQPQDARPSSERGPRLPARAG